MYIPTRVYTQIGFSKSSFNQIRFGGKGAVRSAGAGLNRQLRCTRAVMFMFVLKSGAAARRTGLLHCQIVASEQPQEEN